MKSAYSSWRRKYMNHCAANNCTNNSKDDCPGNREMGVQKRFSDAASEKPNEYIPDEMKHDFLLLSSCDSKMNYPEISSRPAKARQKFYCQFSINVASRRR